MAVNKIKNKSCQFTQLLDNTKPDIRLYANMIPLEDITADDYTPCMFTDKTVLQHSNKGLTDCMTNIHEIRFNSIDKGVDRISYSGEYAVDKRTGMPHNPYGRIGISGCGKLNRYGPNHEVNIIFTRLCEKECEFLDQDKPTTEYRLTTELLLRKRNSEKGQRERALLGGAVLENETFLNAAVRIFVNQTFDISRCTDGDKKRIDKFADDLFRTATVTYKGYVNDTRNTDNAWIESTCFFVRSSCLQDVAFLDSMLNKLSGWVDYDIPGVAYAAPIPNLYLSHAQILEFFKYKCESNCKYTYNIIFISYY